VGVVEGERGVHRFERANGLRRKYGIGEKRGRGETMGGGWDEAMERKDGKEKKEKKRGRRVASRRNISLRTDRQTEESRRDETVLRGVAWRGMAYLRSDISGTGLGWAGRRKVHWTYSRLGVRCISISVVICRMAGGRFLRISAF